MKPFTYMDELKGKSQEEIRKLQEAKLPEQLKYCYDNSELYRAKFDACGAKPEDIRTIEDLRKLPVFMVKDDERSSAEQSLEKYGHPFGLHLCAPVDSLYLTGTTSGTTGMPTFSYTFTENDMEFLAPRIAHRLALAGVGKGDRVAFFFALGIYATTMTLWGLRRLGALPIDIDARAGTDLFTKFIGLTRPTHMACTPSLAEYLVGKTPELLGHEVGDFNWVQLLSSAAAF
jgi:phenylacetate-CoA ligase